MNQAFENWLKSARHDLEKLGVMISTKDGHQTGSFEVNLDSSRFVGTICFWPPNIYEFGFNAYITGEEVVFETINFDKSEELEVYLNRLFFEKLVNV